MKTIFAAALLTANVLATTFNFTAPQGNVAQTDSNYVLAPSFAIEVKDVNAGYKEGVAQIVVNGKSNEYAVKVTNVVNHRPEVTKTFEAVIKSDVLSDGFCDEYESFKYIVTFDETDEYGHYSYIHRVGMKAERTYSWDRCHASNQYETFVYERN